jgi:hypothetical protein
MALIPDFPTFLPSPLAADLNLAGKRLAEQIGGVLPDGTVYPGNIDLDNLVAAPALRNEQKAEPYSEFGVTVGYGDEVWTGVIEAAPLPFDAVLVGVEFQEFKLHTGTLVLTLGGRRNATGYYEPIDLATFILPSTETRDHWAIGGLIPAGIPFGARAVFAPVVADPWFVTFFLKALHRR